MSDVTTAAGRAELREWAVGMQGALGVVGISRDELVAILDLADAADRHRADAERRLALLRPFAGYLGCPGDPDSVQLRLVTRSDVMPIATLGDCRAAAAEVRAALEGQP